jgi:two-component system CheB/CheR fusion protein
MPHNNDHPEYNEGRAADRKHRIYRRKEAAVAPKLELPSVHGPQLGHSEQQAAEHHQAPDRDLSRQVERCLLEHYAPSCVVVNGRFDAVYFSGSTGYYLEHPSGAPDNNILSLARHGLRMHLRTALEEAMREKKTVVREDVHVRSNGGYRIIRLKVRPIYRYEEQPADYFAVIFEPFEQQAPPPELARRPPSEEEETSVIQQLEEELRATRRHLQAIIEDLEASNEELMSTNEELQSTAEELDSSREELQSVNEELSFSNQELRRHIDELASANTDIKNLLESTQIAMMFLDKQLNIKTLTPRMSDLYYLRPSDAGRSIQDMRSKHDYDALEADTAEVLRTSMPVERSVRVEDDEYIMRILPYQTLDDRTDGVVLIFIDVTSQVRARQEIERLRQAQEERAALQTHIARLSIFALSEHEVDPVMRKVVNCVAEDLQATHAEVWRLDEEGQQLRLTAVSGDDGPVEGVSVAADPGNAFGYTLICEQPVMAEDLAGDSRFPYPDHLGREEIASSMSAVIKVDGRTFGVLSMYDKERRQFLPDEMNFLQAVADLLGAVILRKEHEIGHSEAKRRQAFAEAADRMRQAERLASLGTLAAGIAHEVNNPLNSILMNAELGLVSLQSNSGREKLPQLLRTIAEEARRGGSITRNVLQFSRADHYTPKGQADLNNLITRAREHVASVLQEHHVRLDLELGQTSSWLELNQIAMEQAMVNLIGNAAQSGASKIVIKTEREEDHVRVTISDDGRGIPQEEIEHIFDPFYTTRRSQGGSGLGLSLVHRIVSDHNGTVEAHSAPGKGAQFVLRLPFL